MSSVMCEGDGQEPINGQSGEAAGGSRLPSSSRSVQFLFITRSPLVSWKNILCNNHLLINVLVK